MAQTATHHQCAQSQSPTTMRFCPNVATTIGVSEAIVVHRLDYWLSRSKHRFEGRTWVYNTYEAWQEQFPFWSRRTIQATFRRLERLGIVKCSQQYNRSRWDKTKWYTIDYVRLADLVPQPPTAVVAGPEADAPTVAIALVPEAPVDASASVPSIAPEAATDETPDVTMDDAESSPSWITKRSPMRSSQEILNRACASEPDEEARQHALKTAEPMVTAGPHGQKPVNELDVAYEAIPEAERETWYERADQALEAAGMPDWMRIAPTIKEMALQLWVGATIPVLATG